MKTFASLYTVILLFFISVLPAPFGATGGGLYAQDPAIFEHTWYFVNGEFDGESFFPLSYLQGELSFTLDTFTVNHSYCKENGGGSVVEFQNENFILEDFFVILIGVCGDPNEAEFMHKHYSIYGDYADSGIANNPFAYSIESIDDYLQLTIENGDGDWAVYNSVLLSKPAFHQNSFTLYPNPVKEILQVNNFSNQLVTASIYDINGKKIQTHSLENNLSMIDVKALKQGLYFVVFESATGERVSKKFIKY